MKIQVTADVSHVLQKNGTAASFSSTQPYLCIIEQMSILVKNMRSNETKHIFGGISLHQGCMYNNLQNENKEKRQFMRLSVLNTIFNLPLTY